MDEHNKRPGSIDSSVTLMEKVERHVDADEMSHPLGSRKRQTRISWSFTMVFICNVALLAALFKVASIGISQNRRYGVVPEIKTWEIFEYLPIYSDPPSEESEKAWKNLIPAGKGFVTIKNFDGIPDQPKLNKSLPEQHAIVAMFHQLHCLYAIREGYFGLREGDRDRVPVGHLGHCWDYMRQSIMCNADTTLEWTAPPPDDKKGSTGWGYQHQCKDFGAIYSWAEANRWKTTTGIH